MDALAGGDLTREQPQPSTTTTDKNQSAAARLQAQTKLPPERQSMGRDDKQTGRQKRQLHAPTCMTSPLLLTSTQPSRRVGHSSSLLW